MRVLVNPVRPSFHDIVEEGAEFAVAPPLQWRDAPAGLNSDWSFDGQAFTPPSGPGAEALEQARIQAIKDGARAHIVAAIPDWKRENLISRAIELDRKDRLEGLTESEAAELTAIEGVWAWVKAVRLASDAAEQAGTAPGDVAFPPWP